MCYFIFGTPIVTYKNLCSNYNTILDMLTHNASVVMMMLCYIFMVDDKPSTGCGHCTLLNRVQSVSMLVQ